MAASVPTLPGGRPGVARTYCGGKQVGGAALHVRAIRQCAGATAALQLAGVAAGKGCRGQLANECLDAADGGNQQLAAQRGGPRAPGVAAGMSWAHSASSPQRRSISAV